MHETQFTITIFILLLLIASGVAMAAKWVRVPYTLLLVIVGLVISPMHFLPVVHVSPDLILLIFLPALLFEAAWNLKLEHLRENLVPILMMATLGVSFSVGLVGVILHFSIGLSWETALLFGAMISATDPVSVLALFRTLGLPNRLTTIVEGESLFNDGTAVVVFRIILSIVMGVTTQTGGSLALHSLRNFAVVVFGGLAVGAIIGIIASTLTAYFDDHLLEITLTTITAYGSFLLAEALHVSPVIAVLIAGLIIGNHARQKGMSPTTQVAVNSFWEYAAFVVNSLVFLLIGLEIQVVVLSENLVLVGWAVVAMLAARAIAVYGLIPLVNRFSEKVSLPWQHVLFWGGLRGSLSIALALSLPTTVPGRSQLIVMIFGAVIFSLLAQGLTIKPLLRWLGMAETVERKSAYEFLHVQMLTETTAAAELEKLRGQGLVTARVYEAMKPKLEQAHESLSEQLAQFGGGTPAFEQQQQQRLQEHLVNVKKARLLVLMREGLLSEEVYQQISEKLDEEIRQLQESRTEVKKANEK